MIEPMVKRPEFWIVLAVAALIGMVAYTTGWRHGWDDAITPPPLKPAGWPYKISRDWAKNGTGKCPIELVLKRVDDNDYWVCCGEWCVSTRTEDAWQDDREL